MSVTVLVVIVVSIMIVASTLVVFVFFVLASLLLDVTRLVLSRPHKIYWPVASVILLAMPAPLFHVARRHVEVEGLDPYGNGRGLDNDRLGVDQTRRRPVA